MNCLAEVHLEPGLEPDEWRSCLLDLPGGVALKAWDDAGAEVPFECDRNRLRARSGVRLARARIQLTTDLIAASALDEARLKFDRDKLASDDRAGRRTLWISLAAALISAAAAIIIALIAQPGKPSDQPLVQAPPTYRQLDACQQSLGRLEKLAKLPTQTLSDLEAAVQQHEETCRDSLKAAVDSAPN